MSEGKEEKKLPPKGQFYVWDNTVKWTSDDEKKDIIEWCAQNCKKWVFQKEMVVKEKEGKFVGGYAHWQLKISLAKKKRCIDLVNDFPIKEGHWSVSSVNGMHTFTYTMKTATRMDGPWSDKDQMAMREITEDMKHVLATPKKWQTELTAFIKNYKMDTLVHMVIDPMGKNGKSSWCKLQYYEKRAVYVPIMTDAGKLINYIMNRPFYGAYVIDIARNTNKKKYGDLWTAIENLKAGMVYDWRYESRDQMITPPCIIITCNEDLNTGQLSKGRLMKWLIWKDELWGFDQELYESQLFQYSKQQNEASGEAFFFKKKFKKE